MTNLYICYKIMLMSNDLNPELNGPPAQVAISAGGEAGSSMSRREFLGSSVAFFASGLLPMSGVFSGSAEEAWHEPVAATGGGPGALQPEPMMVSIESQEEQDFIAGSGQDDVLLPETRESHEARTSAITDQINEFIELPPSNERSAMESVLWDELEEDAGELSSVHIRHALSGTFSWGARERGMELFWGKRQAGDFVDEGHPPLFNEHIAWAQQYKFHPGVLAFAIEANEAAKKLLLAGSDMFFEAADADQRPTTETIQGHMLSAGGLAELMFQETSGMLNVGAVAAKTQWNITPEYFPLSDDHLDAALAIQREDSGIKYRTEAIPGSLRGDNASGGAVGPQFMPVWARFFMESYQEANARIPEDERLPGPNLWDPFTAMTLSALYVDSSFHGRSNDVDRPDQNAVRPGYGVDRTLSLRKWNPWPPEVEAVSSADDAYREAFAQSNSGGSNNSIVI